MLGAEVMQGSRYPWLKVAQDTQVLQHTAIDACNFDQVIENMRRYWCRQYCNAVFAKAKTSVFVEQNVNYCNWLKQRVNTPVIHGDVGNPEIIKLVSELTHAAPQPISGGFSCQPFSALGDRREEKDPHSQTLSFLAEDDISPESNRCSH